MVVGERRFSRQLSRLTRCEKRRRAVRLAGRLEPRFSVAKRVRSETGVGQMAVSVSYAAGELARKISARWPGRKIMIAGGAR